MAGRKRNRRWLGGVIAAVVVVGLALGAYFGLRPTAAAQTDPVTVTRDVTASLTTLTTSVGASGTMEPAQEAALSFTSAGTVTSVTVAVGDKVSAGQVLATIDPTDLQSAVDAAQASVDAATDDLTTAKSSGTDAAINAATSTLKTKQNALEQAKTALAAATLTAPFDGTVSAVDVTVGQSIGASASSGGQGGGSGNVSATSAVTIITADRYVVSVGVGSADIRKITKGMKAQVTPSGANRPLAGTVTSVGVVASTSSGSSTSSFPVTVALDDPQTNLYAGISATVALITASRDNVLVVPSQAITRGSDGTMTVQKKQADGTYVATPVTIGEVSGSQTEILSGLANGDTVQISVVVATASTNTNSSRQNGAQTTATGNFPGSGGAGYGPPNGQSFPSQQQNGG